MALFLGSKKQKISIGNSARQIAFFSTVASMINGIALLSSENYMLKDKNGLYLTVKESE